jgi:signal transduction histidine kinase
VTRRLYSRIYLHFVGVLLVVGLGSSLVFATGWRAAFIRPWTQRLTGHIAAQISGQPDREHRVQLVRHFSDELDLDLTLRDASGDIEISTGSTLPELSRDDWRELKRGPTVLHKGRNWFVVAPVRDRRSGEILGAVQTFPMRRFAPGNLMRPLFSVALVLIVVGLATAPLARRISRPVERLTEASRRLGQGELGYRIPVKDCPPGHHPHHHTPPLDELGELTRAWNDMAERVQGLVTGQRELLANISHELRSPLARIRVALELMGDDPASAARVNDVKEDLSELERLIDDVLTTSRLEATGLPVRLQRVSIGALLQQLVERGGHDPATQGKEVRLAAPAAPIELDGDGALLKRALWNLVENAAKYGAPPITLGAARAGDQIQLSVTDRGAGIPKEDRERVLQPFYRADRARTPGRGGFGLGLTLAQRIAEVHGGGIHIDTPVDGQGCRVTLEIPAEQGQGVATEADPSDQSVATNDRG